MSKGFKATLFAGAITLSAFAPAFAAAPVISGLPDVQVGDLENSTSTDQNLFVFSDAFKFSDYVSDSDTPDAQLKWSFAEYTASGEGLGPNQYTINGVGPHTNGGEAIAAEDTAGNPKAKVAANAINAASDNASFRDIILSPPSGSAPFGDPTPDQKAAAELGKFVRYYVADPEGNVSHWDAIIKSKDDAPDMLIPDVDGYQEQERDSDLTAWKTSGIVWEGVTLDNPVGSLKITVKPTQGKTRIAGWKNESMLTYDEVGPTKFVHGKFYIHTSNAITSPINEVPAFRVRITNEVLDAAAHFEYAQTGYTGVPHELGYAQANAPDAERAGNPVRPSDLAQTPSLYKVDFDPVDVPAAAGTNIGALMESYAIPDPANGTLTLSEVVLGTYDVKDDSEGTLVYDYNSANGLNGVAGTKGGAKTIASSGAFNAEADFQAGRRQTLQVPSRDPGFQYASITDQGVQGILASTDAVAQNVFGIGLLNLESVSNADKLRISPSKFYRARFYATSDVPARRNPAVEIQSGFRFRFQTGANTISYLNEFVGLAQKVTGTAASDELAVQALPGPDSQNPDTDATLNTAGEKGGWYSVLVSSPLDPDGIRQDYEELVEQQFQAAGGKGFFDLATSPGPGVDAPSLRDVKLGVDLVQTPQTLRVLPTVVIPDFAQQNVSEVRIKAVKVYEYAPIDDGGYDFVVPAN